ncbi:MAG: hypothetical protein HJJLKODD_02495 [Phycisphaerae bacterium]|nr:hypothetical protein [Phycisphaerae bacterium]
MSLSANNSAAARLLLIGLDGATWNILRPMMQQGRMPHLQALLERGSHGVLMSTIPPITPAAWTTFMTGQGPGRHGILDFERYNPTTHELRFNSTYEIRQRTIWQMLSDAGRRVGVIQVPMTYPPKKVNGFLISGFDTPGTDVPFTWPPELKDELLQRWPEFSFKTTWQRRMLGGLSIYRENLDYINRSFDLGVELTHHFGEKYGWDVLMVMYKLVDNLQHKVWKHLDPRLAGLQPDRAELAAGCFAHLDQALGQLFDYAKQHDAGVMIMSDHGHGALDGKIQANQLLVELGHLTLDTARQTRNRSRQILRRWLGRKREKFSETYGIDQDLAVDWSRTRAFIAHAGMCGFLYINLRGRQPQGVVEPRDYEALRNDIIAQLCDFNVDVPADVQQRYTRTAPGFQPIGDEPLAPPRVKIFEAIYKPEELYHCRREDQPWLPDLMLVPAPGLSVIRKIRGGDAVRWVPWRKMEGTHRMEGVFAAAGPLFRHLPNTPATLADLAPTILAAQQLPIPDNLDGRVLTDIFRTTLALQYESATAHVHQAAEDIFSEDEKKALLARLSDLGYLE